MGGRWVAAALAVLGIISSMSTPVEGEGLPQMKLSHAERILSARNLIVKAGLAEGTANCERLDDDIWKIVKALNGMTAEKIQEHYKVEWLGDSEQMIEMKGSKTAEKIETTYLESAKKSCNMKEALKCKDGTCVKCPADDKSTDCENLNKIKDTKDPEPKTGGGGDGGGGSGGSGGWSVRPVNGALVAALLALFSLAA